MYSLSTLQQIKQNVVKELTMASAGNHSSYPFIKHNLSHHSHIEEQEIFQVLTIGGSFYRNAILKKTEGKTIIQKQTKGELPVFKTKNVFLNFIQHEIEPGIRHLALNFAYPLQPVLRNDYLDGVLQSGSKEHTFDGLVNLTVGDTIEQYLQHSANRRINVSVANDTITQLLSGLTRHSWETLAAGIVGTGLNFAIFLDKYTAVNLEAANFNQFPQSEEGIILDNRSAAPGRALYEKETSGGYLYQIFNECLLKKNIRELPLRSTDQLDGLALANIPEVSELAQSILDRSASLVGAQVAGILEFVKRDLTFVMQGSLYWKGNLYATTMEKTVEQLSKQYKAAYINIEDSDIYGAAELLTHS